MISPETLRRFPLFAGLDFSDIKDLAMIGKEIICGDGEWVFHEGDEADALYILLAGTVDLQLALDNGRTVYTSLTTVVEGELIGWSALVPPHSYKLGAVANGEVRLVKLDRTGLRETLSQKPGAGYTLTLRVAEVISDRLTKMHVRLASLTEV
jgi:CRP-like cAMP-binding protein